jgi:hypothetical protein
LDEILARAEPAPEQDNTESGDLLNSFKVADFALEGDEEEEKQQEEPNAPDDFWDSIIPEEERKAANVQTQDMFLPPRRKTKAKTYGNQDPKGETTPSRKKRKNATPAPTDAVASPEEGTAPGSAKKSKTASGASRSRAKGAGSAKKSGSSPEIAKAAGSATPPRARRSESSLTDEGRELKKLIQAVKSIGDISRARDILQMSDVSTKSEQEVVALLQGVVDDCRQLVLTSPEPKKATINFHGYSVKALELLNRLDDMSALRQLVSSYPNQTQFRLTTSVKPWRTQNGFSKVSVKPFLLCLPTPI